MSISKLVLMKDSNGNVTYGIPFSDTGYETTLTAGAAQSLPVPADCNCAVFSYSSGIDVFVDPVTTAALPGATFAATTADMNPVMRTVIPSSTLSFISDASGYVKVSFYQVSSTYTGIG